MGVVQQIKVQHFRSHTEYLLEPAPGVTIVTGYNGSGKTSLLEALYVALRGTSFKGSDSDIVSRGAQWWRVDVTLDGEPRSVKFDPSKPTGRKQFIVDEKTTLRLPPKNKYPVVLFEPDDLRLLHGSPARRRKFIDTLISQLSAPYATALRKYDRALKQRNNLLKSGAVQPDELFAWSMSLAESGAYIIEQRQAFIELLNADIGQLYRAISGTNDTVTIEYSKHYTGAIQQVLLHELEAAKQRDMYLGSTSAGPHRHDVAISLNSVPAGTTASRGETRTIILALKFLEVAITQKHTGNHPIVLLDDVFSELDATRQKLLTEYLKDNQIIITSATSQVAGAEFMHVTLGE